MLPIAEKHLLHCLPKVLGTLSKLHCFLSRPMWLFFLSNVYLPENIFIYRGPTAIDQRRSYRENIFPAFTNQLFYRMTLNIFIRAVNRAAIILDGLRSAWVKMKWLMYFSLFLSVRLPFLQQALDLCKNFASLSIRVMWHLKINILLKIISLRSFW